MNDSPVDCQSRRKALPLILVLEHAIMLSVEVIICLRIIYLNTQKSLQQRSNFSVKALKRRQIRYFNFVKAQAVFMPIRQKSGIYRQVCIMEFNEKLQELRKQKELTQEELAKKLYVSRAAVSKWESGRGYPNIESLKAIAKFFSVTVDELLSTDEVLTIAEEDSKRKEKHFRELTYGLLDICIAMLLFLPFFADKTEGIVRSVPLITLSSVQPYLKAAYLTVVVSMIVMGVLTLALQNCQAMAWVKSKTTISLILGALAVLVFMISSHPYAAVFAFALLAIKTLMLMKRR